MTRDFARTVAAALAALALALWAASGLQVRQGLAPLGRLQQALTRLRAGQPGALKESFPAEVQPLVDELNALLVDKQRLVHQAREQTANLAHALKTPLAVLDNAFRWARSQVQVRLAVEPAAGPVADGAAAATAPCLRLAIDDDGTGIPPAQRQAALQRGRRLDETEPGSGLGLAIADELVRLAGGALQLQDSPLGGLRVSLQLPLAP